MTRPDSCPTCDSPHPALHPLKDETVVYNTLGPDYVLPCPDLWHKDLP